MYRKVLIFVFFLAFCCQSSAQNVQPPTKEIRGEITIDGQIFEYLVDECGDTIVMAQLTEVPISSSRTFDNPEDYRKYRRYRKYAYIVYPYASESIRIFKELEVEVNEMNKKDRRKHIRRLQKELKEEFEEPLKGLTRLQGMILFKMIEKELETPMFTLIKDLKNGLTAFYWNTLGSLYGHHLKDGYTRGDDPILDMVLDDIDISYEVPDGAKSQNSRE
ncbi:MAG: DUF4294 domain-containing protein [Saprospiraceae bacterium]|nr:DUF4294 domain-containing protein [Saprospiraceae bacterium]